MTERSANDITTPARLVLDAYIIDPVTKLPMAPGVASDGATANKQDEQTDLLGEIKTALTTPATELPPEHLQATTGLTVTIIKESTTGDTTLVAAVSGQTTRVHRMKFTCDGACLVLIKRGSTELDRFRFPASGGAAVLEFSSRPWYVTGANEALVINTSTTANVDGSVETVTSA